jgi:hypothetical protein
MPSIGFPFPDPPLGHPSHLLTHQIEEVLALHQFLNLQPPIFLLAFQQSLRLPLMLSLKGIGERMQNME